MALAAGGLYVRSMKTRPIDAWSRVLKGAVGLLVTVGVLSALSRYFLPHALHLTIATPLYGSYAPEQLPVLAEHPVSEALHRVGGSLYMLLGVTQFLPRLRARRPGLHRWAGRVFLGLSVVAGGTGAFMALTFPYELGERLPSVLFGAIMVVAAVKAYLHIRRREIQAHREWVTRCFAVGLGIGTIRVMAVILLNTTALTTRQIFVPVFWMGWTVTLAAAELWIRATRPARAAAPVGEPVSAR